MFLGGTEGSLLPLRGGGPDHLRSHELRWSAVALAEAEGPPLRSQSVAAAGAGSVAGRLLTREGQPADAVRVSVIPAPAPNTRVADGQNYYPTQRPVSITLTDRQGNYRLENIPPGRYFVVASIIGEATYFPGTTDADRATVVTVTAGSSAPGTDFGLLMPLGGRVTGRVTPPPPNANAERVVLSGLRLTELQEVAVRADGTFDFGRVPKGAYLVSFFPTPPGMPSRPFDVGDGDVTTLEFTRPAVRKVTGRVVVDRGPLPNAILAFVTEQSHVGATINADGTFTTSLHAGTHLADIGGMPVGYGLSSVRVGQGDGSKGVIVSNADVTGVVINVRAPSLLPELRGRIEGTRPAGELRLIGTGPVYGAIETTVRPDGTFSFGLVAPGLYRLRVAQVPSLAPVLVVVNTSGGGEATITLR
jgi:hypothetical protein